MDCSGIGLGFRETRIPLEVHAAGCSFWSQIAVQLQRCQRDGSQKLAAHDVAHRFNRGRPLITNSVCGHWLAWLLQKGSVRRNQPTDFIFVRD